MDGQCHYAVAAPTFCADIGTGPGQGCNRHPPVEGVACCIASAFSHPIYLVVLLVFSSKRSGIFPSFLFKNSSRFFFEIPH
jgi:hypothetical protein